MKLPKLGTGFAALRHDVTVVAQFTLPAIAGTGGIASLELPGGFWWRVNSVAFGFDATGGAGNFQLLTSASLGTLRLWAALQSVPLATLLFDGGATFALQLQPVAIVSPSQVTQALPETIVPGGTLISVSDAIATDAFTTSQVNIVATGFMQAEF